jgi:hypothetical protein
MGSAGSSPWLLQRQGRSDGRIRLTPRYRTGPPPSCSTTRHAMSGSKARARMPRQRRLGRAQCAENERCNPTGSHGWVVVSLFSWASGVPRKHRATLEGAAPVRRREERAQAVPRAPVGREERRRAQAGSRAPPRAAALVVAPRAAERPAAERAVSVPQEARLPPADRRAAERVEEQTEVSLAEARAAGLGTRAPEAKAAERAERPVQRAPAGVQSAAFPRSLGGRQIPRQQAPSR